MSKFIYDPSQPKKQFIEKEVYTEKLKRVDKKLDRHGVEIDVETEIEVYNNKKHSDAILDTMSEAFKELTQKGKDKDVKIEAFEGECYRGVPIEKLSPEMKIVYALEKAQQKNNAPDSSTSDV